FRELLTEQKSPTTDWDRRPLIFHRFNDHYPHSAVIVGNYKLVKLWKTGKLELFNLAVDPGETRNIALDQTQKTEELAVILKSYLREVEAEILEEYDPGE